jgi:hypothetical protein
MESHDLAGSGPESTVSIGSPPEESATVAEHNLDDHIAELIAANPGIGAVLIDAAGHVKLFAPTSGKGHCGFTLAPGIYSSIQSAIDAATDGDAIYIVAGTYREQLTIRGKQLDLLGAIGDDGSPLVTIESPDVAKLDVDPVDDESGSLTAQCAVIRIRNDAHVIVRHLVIDGRNQGSLLRQTGALMDFSSISTADSDTIVEHVATRGFDFRDAVRLLDGVGRLKGTYTTIQAAVSFAVGGDEVAVTAGVYREDVFIDQPLTLSCPTADPASRQPGTEALIIGRVVLAANAGTVVIDGVSVEGSLDMEPGDGSLAAVTLRNSRIEAGGGARAICATLPSSQSVSRLRFS